MENKEINGFRGKRRKSQLWLNRPKRRRTVDEQGSYMEEEPLSTPICDSNTTVLPSSSKLQAAPLKNRKKNTPPKARKSLFTKKFSENFLEEITGILPAVFMRLKRVNKLVPFCLFLQLVSEDKFPLHNISFLLFLDVVQWYGLANTSKMSYPDESIKFWKVLYRLFHGKALRFMSGIKSTGQILTEECGRGCFDPQSTCINFAVPSIQSVSNYAMPDYVNEIPREIPPGVIEPAIALRPKDKSYVLSVDGKKLAPGLSENGGDQDLFGHEENETLEMTKERLANEISTIESLRENWVEINDEEKIVQLEKVVKLLSVRIKDMKTLFLKQTIALQKFTKEAEQNWQESKYVYAISSIQAQIFQIRHLVTLLLNTTDAVLKTESYVRNSFNVFTTESEIDLCSQLNCITLKEPEDIPVHLKEDVRFVKQRSAEWFSKRDQYKLTGSTIYESIGLETLKKQRKHFDRVMKGIVSDDDLPEDVKSRMEHGTKSEIHAIATLVSKILPFYYPHLKYVEEGAHVINSGVADPLFLVSPDGSLGTVEVNSQDIPMPICGCEFKCPVPSSYKTPVHYDIPCRYIPQILSEMASLKVNSLIYLCWTEESSTVFRAQFDPVLWQMIQAEAESLYGSASAKKPTKLSPRVKEISSKMDEYRKQYTEFMCEAPSVRGVKSQPMQSCDFSLYLFPVTDLFNKIGDVVNITEVLNVTVSVVKEAYQLGRKKASEVLVWLLSDTDRSWNPEIPHAAPIGYAMKGYSLPIKPMREMHDHVLQSCFDKGIDVVCSCFDGQWLKLATRDADNKPLTLLQLQNYVYEAAAKMNRNDIVRYLKESPVSRDIVVESVVKQKNTVAKTVSSHMLQKISYTINQVERKPQTTQSFVAKQSEDTMSCLPDEALELLIPEGNQASDFTGKRVESQSVDLQSVIEETNEEMVNRSTTLTNAELESIMVLLQNSKKKATANKWKVKSISDIDFCMLHIDELQKLSHDELNVFIDSTKAVQRSKGTCIKKSWNLQQKANAISVLVGSGKQKEVIRKVRRMSSLKEYAAKAVKQHKKCSKYLLNNICATVMYDAAYRKWLHDAPFSEDITIDGVGQTSWFSFPECNTRRERLEAKCTDAHHLLVNLRTKVCKDGLAGIRKQAWHSVAESNNQIISRAVVVDLVDKQNSAYAKRTFSSKVENEMRKLGFETEADFCKVIREWQQAEDMPGLSAVERTTRRLKLKEYLLKDEDFGRYPMYGMYVKGYPKVMYEGFLQRIDTMIQLYRIVKSGSYNSRAILTKRSSEMEPTKLGCPKAISIPRLMSAVTEIQHYRSDPSTRTFKMATTRKPVYPQTRLAEYHISTLSFEGNSGSDSAKITLRDLEFDSDKRKRTKQRKSKRSDVSKPHEVSRGCQPSRSYHKCDESKLLPTTRLGIELKDPL